MRGRREGDTEAAKLHREERVYKLVLIGLAPGEIAGQMGVTLRTIQNDCKQIRARLIQTVQAAELRSLKLAMAELTLLWREGFSLYFRAPKDRASKDDRMVKLAILHYLARISIEKNRLVLPAPQFHIVGTQAAMRPEQLDEKARATIFAQITNQMPAELRNAVIAWVSKLDGSQSASMPI